MPLKILYRDDHLIAINKPTGLMVHRSSMANDATEFAIQLLRDQIGQRVYPVHRLDRKTSGVLLFALNGEANRQMQQLFAGRKVTKKYLAIVRGYTMPTGEIDYEITNDRGQHQQARTDYLTIQKAEIAVPFGKHPTSRYSMVELTPVTGRFHQLRKHMAHIFHPIIGDRPHGCNKQNRLWKEKFGMTTMLLHASMLQFQHPFTGIKMSIEAELQEEFVRAKGILRL